MEAIGGGASVEPLHGVLTLKRRVIGTAVPSSRSIVPSA
jgi:hypothetical protein